MPIAAVPFVKSHEFGITEGGYFVISTPPGVVHASTHANIVILMVPAVSSWYTYRRHEGHSSWWCGLAIIALASVIASPSFCLSSAVACEASASPLTQGNKKAQPHHTRVALGHGRLRFQ